MLMLWHDDSPKPLTERISRAADYYRSKYGKTPTLCLIPIDEVIDGTPEGISLEARANVLPCHLMVGTA